MSALEFMPAGMPHELLFLNPVCLPNIAALLLPFSTRMDACIFMALLVSFQRPISKARLKVLELLIKDKTLEGMSK